MTSSELNTNGSLQQTEPALCSNGCGFFGTAATKGLCSKCYRDSAKPLIFQLPGRTALTIKASVQSDQDYCSSSLAAATKKKKNRCGKCNKKVGLTGFQCRCGNMFCGWHRYAEEHDCDFDFKAKGRSELAKANPVVKADKLGERLK